MCTPSWVIPLFVWASCMLGYTILVQCFESQESSPPSTARIHGVANTDRTAHGTGSRLLLKGMYSELKYMTRHSSIWLSVTSGVSIAKSSKRSGKLRFCFSSSRRLDSRRFHGADAVVPRVQISSSFPEAEQDPSQAVALALASWSLVAPTSGAREGASSFVLIF